MVRTTPFLLAVCFIAAVFVGAACSTASGSTADTAAPAAVARHTYDVRDLVMPKQSTDTPFIALDVLVQNLKEATDLTCWKRPDWTVQPADAGYVVVDASPEMHRRVFQYLGDLRRFALAKQ